VLVDHNLNELVNVTKSCWFYSIFETNEVYFMYDILGLIGGGWNAIPEPFYLLTGLVFGLFTLVMAMRCSSSCANAKN
jgi:hypothetical protein